MAEQMVSIVVPVYNVEKYLSKCVDSLLHQKYENIEIILIDDGSPDNCPGIIDRYAEQHDTVHAFHKPNGGLGDARNYGVQHANGEWIVFVDSDDYVTPSYISDLWALKQKHGADMSMAWVLTIDEEGRQLGKKLHFESYSTRGAEAIWKAYTGNGVGWSAYNKLFPKWVLLKYPFPKGYYEDMACMYRILDSVKCIAVGDCNENYAYVQRKSGSILNSRLSEKHMHVFDICEEFGRFIDDKYPEMDILKTVLYERGVIQILQRQQMSSGDFKRVFRLHRARFRKSILRIIRHPDIPRKIKQQLALLCTTPGIYKAARAILTAKKR